MASWSILPLRQGLVVCLIRKCRHRAQVVKFSWRTIQPECHSMLSSWYRQVKLKKNWPSCNFFPFYKTSFLHVYLMLIERAGCWPLPVSGSSPRMDLPRWVWPLFPCKTKGQIFFQEWPEWQNEFLAGPKAMFGEQVLKRIRGEGLLLSSFLPIISSTFPQS